MLKIVIIFMLLTLIGSPMNTTSPENTSMNKSLLNNSSLNGTQESDLGIDLEPFIWFPKATKPDIASDLRQTLEDIKHDYLKDAVDSYSAEKSMTEEEFSRRSIPPAINEELDRYNPESDSVPIDPIEFPDDEWSPWLQEPPWPQEEMHRGCSEPVCDKDGICYQECWD